MEEKSVIKRILIAVIVVLIGAVCIAGFLALKHSHGGSWDVLLVFGIKCTSMSSFWRFMIIYFIIFELLIWVEWLVVLEIHQLEPRFQLLSLL